MLFVLYAAACLAVSDAMVCYHGICDRMRQEPLLCQGSIIKYGGLCGCTDVCAKVKGEVCQAELVHGMIPQGTCDAGLMCQRQNHMRFGLGTCVKSAAPVQSRDSQQSLCQRKRIASMISQIYYRGQWFPKCDGNGLFQSQQCDNTGTCFCVDINTGVVDSSTKVQGPADCGTGQVSPRELLDTACQRARMVALTSMIVYKGKWTPRCDQNGQYLPEQCDNTGACFCVAAATGRVDSSTKVQGPANCS